MVPYADCGLQETKVVSLKKLAKIPCHSSSPLSSHIPPTSPALLPSTGFSKKINDHETTSGINVFQTTKKEVPQQNQRKLTRMKPSAPFNTLLVTATLTALHSKLISDCDQTLASTLLVPSMSTDAASFPADRLHNIVHDLKKMSDMVEWEDGDGPMSRKSVAEFFELVDRKIADGQTLINTETGGGKPKAKKDSSNDGNQAVACAVKEIVITPVCLLTFNGKRYLTDFTRY